MLARLRAAAIVVALLGGGAIHDAAAAQDGAGIHDGATVAVKPNSIWFQDAAQLTRWQALKRGGDAAALAHYEESLLSRRDAWQFLASLPVKVLGYDRQHHRVHVEMQREGRLQGTKWLIDTDALAP